MLVILTLDASREEKGYPSSTILGDGKILMMNLHISVNLGLNFNSKCNGSGTFLFTLPSSLFKRAIHLP